MTTQWQRGVGGWLPWAAALACAPLAALPSLDAWRFARLEAIGPTDTPQPPGDFRGLRLGGALALQAGRPALAEVYLRRAIAASPLDAESWRLLASVARARHRGADQARLLRIAGGLSWRDAPTQRRLMLTAFRADDLAAGVTHADALLRLQPDDDLALAALLTAADYPDGQAALATHLATTPAWRKSLFAGVLVATTEDADGLVALLRRMRTTAAPPTVEENVIAVSKLIQAGYGPLALAYWRDTGGRAPGHDFTNNDPDFVESLPTLKTGDPGLPFGWTLNRGAGVQVNDGRDAAGHPALAFDGPPDGTPPIVSRTLLLAPGAYTLAFAGSADGRPTDRFRPRFTCAVSGRTLPFDTLRPARNGGMPVSRVALVVPGDCTALILGFGLAAGDDGQVHGFVLSRVNWSRQGA